MLTAAGDKTASPALIGEEVVVDPDKRITGIEGMVGGWTGDGAGVGVVVGVVVGVIVNGRNGEAITGLVGKTTVTTGLTFSVAAVEATVPLAELVKTARYMLPDCAVAAVKA